jgi:hypothetical protein
LVLVVVLFSRVAAAEEVVGVKKDVQRPTHAFAQVGTGLLEVGHVEAGAFLTPRLTIEAMASWAGVFGAHYGGGAMYSFGTLQGVRPPRHAFLVGARVMFDPTFSFVSGGDTLRSYGVVPIGYGFLADSGLYVRATAGLVVMGERTTPAPGMSETKLVVAPAMFTAAIGYAF